MKNNTIGIFTVLAGAGAIFIQHDYAWIVSAILIGGGTGLFFWKSENK